MSVKTKDKKIYIYYALIVVLIELSVFNFRTIESFFLKETIFPETSMEVAGAEAFGEGVYRIGDEGNAVIYLKRMAEALNGRSLHNVYADIYLPEAEDNIYTESGCMYITPYVRDAGHDQYDILAEHVYREDIEDSKFLWITPAGGVKTIALNIRLSEGSVFQIKNIKLNAHRGFMISPVRLIVLILVALAFFALRGGSALWKEEVNGKNAKNELLAAALGICLILPALVLGISSHALELQGGFMPYQYLAEAFAAGQLSLKEIPAEALAQLDNPYDITLRDAAGLQPYVDYLWDMAYRNGRYYCYFGPVPCVLFYLPVYLITGAHLSDGILMMILAAFVYAGIYMALKEWLKRHAPGTPFAYLLLFTGMIFAGSGMMADIAAPDAHDIPRVAGLAFVAWGLYLWQRSVRTDKRGLNNALLAGGSLCMALAVGCRPNQLFYSFMALPIFGGYLKTGEGFEKKDRSVSIVSLLAPFVPVAALLMAYNALRFGSIFDFGYDYQLTVLDYSKKNILSDRIVIGLYEYLIRLPRMSYRFPFMEEGSFIQENAFGHGSFYYTWGYGGMLVCNLLMWFIPAVFVKKNRDKGAIWLVGLSVVNMLVNICVAGVAYHYRVDFAAAFLAAGAIGAVRLRESMSDDAKALIRNFIIVAFVLSMIYHSCFYYTGSLKNGDTALYYSLLYGWLG